jgi:hypothetical protein
MTARLFSNPSATIFGMDDKDAALKAALEPLSDQQLRDLIARCRAEERRNRHRPETRESWRRRRRFATGVLAIRDGLMPDRLDAGRRKSQEH